MTMLSRTTTLAVAALVGVAAAAFLDAGPARAVAPPAMRMSFVQGEVQIKPSTAEDYGPATVNQPVAEGDQLWLPEGALSELQMQNGTYLRLDQNSAAQILTATKENALQVNLTQGHAYVFYDAPKGGSIQLDTPKHSIKAFENAVFRVDLSEKVDTVGVLDGNVEVETAEGMKRLGRGQMLTFAEDGSVDIGPAGRPDDWENWNNQRNAAQAPKEHDDGKKRLPKELQTYSGDLSSGKWVETKEHGYGWRPQDVDDDWTPYDNGRWVMYGGEYTWVGYESWGWAPYHYGRWVYIPGEGWLWVPPAEDDVYWAPGYVAWYETDGYIGWAPLWPGEYYYGYGYYGRYSYDIHVGGHHHHHHHYDHYHHFGDHHGMKVVSRDHFLHHHGEGRHGYRYERGGLHHFGDKGHDFHKTGGPSFKGGHEHHFATVKHFGADKAPPSHVARFHTANFKSSRPMSMRSGQSSFAPGQAPKSLRTRTVHDQKSVAGFGKSGGGQHYRMSGPSGGHGLPGSSRFHSASRGGGGGGDRGPGGFGKHTGSLGGPGDHGRAGPRTFGGKGGARGGAAYSKHGGPANLGSSHMRGGGQNRLMGHGGVRTAPHGVRSGNRNFGASNRGSHPRMGGSSGRSQFSGFGHMKSNPGHYGGGGRSAFGRGGGGGNAMRHHGGGSPFGRGGAPAFGRSGGGGGGPAFGRGGGGGGGPAFGRSGGGGGGGGGFRVQPKHDGRH